MAFTGINSVFGAGLSYDPTTNEMFQFGGYIANRVNDVYVLSNANGLGGTPDWQQLSPTPDPVNGLPTPRGSHTQVYDAASSRMTIFGGTQFNEGNGNDFNDVWVLSLGPLPVAIDIKPGSSPNSINLKSKGTVPVAILGSPSFDVGDVAVATVEFAGASPVHFSFADVNFDGEVDLVLHFRTKDLELTSVDTEATLTGETTGGSPIEGTDSVRIVH